MEKIPANVVKASDVINVKVMNSAEEDLGKIEELIIDKTTGNVCYAVLSFGGFLGMGNKLFALPWNAIKYDNFNDKFILNISKEKLENAPGFDKNNWPNWSNREWATSIYDYYGTAPYWEK